jgi:Na+-transporting methylmalonyl-CoA/oxaloacetate decarboxylase beta subunit
LRDFYGLKLFITAEVTQRFSNFTIGNGVMIFASLVLIYLAVFKEIEPVLLLPIGFGCLLANIPLAGMTAAEGMTKVIYDAGIKTELFPLLIFIGVGAMIDFSPLLAQPTHGSTRRSGTVRHLRHVDAGNRLGLSTKSSRIHRRHRRH